MIPSVDVRQVRPCEICHCYWEATCYHDGVGCSINGPRTEFGGDHRDRNYWFKDDCDKIPCIYHLTKEEYHEQLNSMAKNIVTYKFERPIDVKNMNYGMNASEVNPKTSISTIKLPEGVIIQDGDTITQTVNHNSSGANVMITITRKDGSVENYP